MTMDIEIENIDAFEGTLTLAGSGEEGRADLVNLQMVMVNSSLNHEYMKKAYDKSKSYTKRQELLVRMTHLKTLYFAARKKLSECDPERLASLEDELQLQKMAVFSENSLH